MKLNRPESQPLIGRDRAVSVFLKHFDELRPRVLGILRSTFGLSPEEAEDLLQEVCLKLLRTREGESNQIEAEVGPVLSADNAVIAKPQFDEDRQAFALALRVAYTTFIDLWRKRRRQCEEQLAPIGENVAVTDEQYGPSRAPSPEFEVFEASLEEIVPELLRTFHKISERPDREVIQALWKSAEVFECAHNAAERLQFVHAYLFKQAVAYGFPPHRVVKLGLCADLDLSPGTVDVRIHRLLPSWRQALRLAFSPRARRKVSSMIVER
jgi:DNA-directed RNA polymerase specialized sigma24 family protein